MVNVNSNLRWVKWQPCHPWVHSLSADLQHPSAAGHDFAIEEKLWVKGGRFSTKGNKKGSLGEKNDSASFLTPWAGISLYWEVEGKAPFLYHIPPVPNLWLFESRVRPPNAQVQKKRKDHTGNGPRTKRQPKGLPCLRSRGFLTFGTQLFFFTFYSLRFRSAAWGDQRNYNNPRLLVSPDTCDCHEQTSDHRSGVLLNVLLGFP